MSTNLASHNNNKKPHRSHARSAGFTLIEVGLVMLVIAAIVGLVVGGQKVVKRMELNSYLADAKAVGRVANEFQETYNALPGDFSSASSVFTAATDGDGSGFLDDAAERHQFWEHLNAANMLPNGLSFADANGAGYIPYGDGVKGFAIDTNGNGALVLTLQGPNGEPVLTGADAWSLEQMINDGGGATVGIMTGADGLNAAGLCINGSEYVLDSSIAGCAVSFNLTDMPLNQGTVSTFECSPGQGVGTVVDSATTCPTGYLGRYQQVCTAAGWADENLCKVATCQGGGAYGDSRSTGCPSGYSGAVTQSCSAAGVWQNTANSCAPTNGVCTDVNATKTLECPANQTGAIYMVCSGGVWTLDQDTCADIECSAGQNVGSTRTQACTEAGYTGNVVEVCSADSNWTIVREDCVLDTGDCSGSGAGTTRPLNCPDGMSGTVEQTCTDLDGGTTFEWRTTTYQCVGLGGCGSFNTGDSRTGVKACPAGQQGTITETCQPNGSWTASSANCASILCKAAAGGNDGGATWGDSTAGTNNVAGTCLSGYTGSSSRDCSITGIWQTPSSSCTGTLTPCSVSITPEGVDNASSFIRPHYTSGADWAGCVEMFDCSTVTPAEAIPGSPSTVRWYWQMDGSRLGCVN